MRFNRLLFNLNHAMNARYFDQHEVARLQLLCEETSRLLRLRLEQEYAHWTALISISVYTTAASLYSPAQHFSSVALSSVNLFCRYVNPLVNFQLLTIDSGDSEYDEFSRINSSILMQPSCQHVSHGLLSFNQDLLSEVNSFSSIAAVFLAAASCSLPLLFQRQMPAEYPKLGALCAGICGMWVSNLSQAAGALVHATVMHYSC